MIHSDAGFDGRDDYPNIVRIQGGWPENWTETHIENWVRSVAEFSEGVFVTNHARQRQNERDITDVMLFRVLRSGHVEPGSWARNANGDWECEMSRRMPNGRDVTAAIVADISGRMIIVKTVMWKDVR